RSVVGWVERSETHHSHYPNGGVRVAQPTLRSGRACDSVPLEIDPAQLLAEARAGVDRAAEIVLAEDVGVDRPARGDRGVARVAAHQRQLAEEIAGAEPRDLVPGALDLDLALRDQEQFLTDLALANDHSAWHVLAA